MDSSIREDGKMMIIISWSHLVTTFPQGSLSQVWPPSYDESGAYFSQIPQPSLVRAKLSLEDAESGADKSE